PVSRRKMRLGTWQQRWRNIRLMKLASEEHGAAADRVESLDLQRFLTQERHRIHLVGVAGSGMSGLAALLIEFGHTVSGSDKDSTCSARRWIASVLLCRCRNSNSRNERALGSARQIFRC